MNLVKTSADGSSTVYSPQFDEHYHSLHGAVQESTHVFIKAGLEKAGLTRHSLKILEMGFGTGLNCLLTLLENERMCKDIRYYTLEAFPLQPDVLEKLNHPAVLAGDFVNAWFEKIHSAPWNRDVAIDKRFSLLKREITLQEFSAPETFDLVYYDAFSPATQPELWTGEIFGKLYSLMSEDAILVTYCSKGSVKRNLKQAGFTVESIQGPPGKREMTRAIRSKAS